MKYFLGLLVIGLVCWGVSALTGGRKDLAEHQYQMRGTFLGQQDLSGLASLDGRNGVIVSDEPRCAQAITIDPARHTITAGAQLPLFAIEGTVEADLEAVAADEANHCYYAIGSHGASKKKGEFQEERCHIFRIPAEAKSGVPMAKGIATGSLLPWLATQPTFKGSLQKPLQQRGFNIEGLACKAGKLYIGVRGPNVKGHTFVIEMAPEPLFNNALPTGIIHELPVGAGQGIREIAALPDGFLVLTGNAGSEPSKQFPESLDHTPKNPSALWWWRPGRDNALIKLLALPSYDGKAEGLLVAKADATQVEVVIIFDSGENGAPLTLVLGLPASAD